MIVSLMYVSGIIACFSCGTWLLVGGGCYNHYVAKKLLNSGTYALGGKEHDAKKNFAGGPLKRPPHSRYILATC